MTPRVGAALVAVLSACGGAPGCGGTQPEPQAAHPAHTAPPPPGLYQEMTGGTSPTAPPVGGTPGCVPGTDGRCPPPAAGTATGAGEPAPAPKPPPPKPGTVRGGLARGEDSAADKALYAGDTDYLADRYASAKQHYAKAKALAPKDPAPRVGLLRVALALSGIPTDYAAAPKNAKIRALLREADAVVALDPGYGPAHVERGRVQLILGLAEDALKSLERGAELAPADPEAHSALGVALLATGKAEPALQRFQKAADLDPDNPHRLANLGTAFMMRGRVVDAVRAYERAVLLAPTDARARGDLGTALLAANKLDQALPHLKKAVELAPDRATFLSNLGYALQQKGDLDGAIATYKQALSKDDKLGSAWINYGTALAQKNQLAEAEKAFKKALAIDASDPRAKANLEELEELKKKQKP